MQAKAKPPWQALFQRHIDRGPTKTRALNALVRKLARVAFALTENETGYVPKTTRAET